MTYLQASALSDSDLRAAIYAADIAATIMVALDMPRRALWPELRLILDDARQKRGRTGHMRRSHRRARERHAPVAGAHRRGKDTGADRGDVRFDIPGVADAA